MKYPSTGCDAKNVPYPYQVKADGHPFAGYADEKTARAAVNSYGGTPRNKSINFTLEYDGRTLTTVSSPQKKSIAFSGK